MKNLITVFEYEDSPVSFKADDGTTMVNATSMARAFGKKPIDWLRLPSTQEYLNYLSEDLNLPISESEARLEPLHSTDATSKDENSFCTPLIVTRRGNFSDKREQGTWMREEVALEFARWLSPKFAIWCNRRVKEFMNQRNSAMSAQVSTELLAKVEQTVEMQSQIIELQNNLSATTTRYIHLWEQLSAVLNILPQTATITEIAERLGLEPSFLNHKLELAGVIRREDGNVCLTEKYADYPLARTCVYNGDEPKTYLRWTTMGQIFVSVFVTCCYDVDLAWQIFGNGACIRAKK